MKIEIVADRKVIKADGKDLSYITIALLDDGEVIARNKNFMANFYVSGDAHIVGFEDDTRCISGKFKTINSSLNSGMASLVLQAGKTPRIIAVTALAAGLKSNQVKIKMTKAG